MKNLSLFLCIFFTNAFCSCPDSATLSNYVSQTVANYKAGEAKIATAILDISNSIVSSINTIEETNINLLQTIIELEKSQAISKLKQNFHIRQHNEVQSIINNIKGQ